MKPLNVLLACEKSQIGCKAFLNRGHNAFSNDIQDCSGPYPERHLKMDVFQAIQSRTWDRIISFQPCTDLAVSGAKHFWYKRQNGTQEKSIRFFFEVWKLSDCSENPIGILGGGKYIKQWFPELHAEMMAAGFPFKPSQIIQPWMFGHGETKATCLFIRNKELPLLIPTDIVEGREQRIWKMPPSKDRANKRSESFPGILNAIASQWSPDLTLNV